MAARLSLTGVCLLLAVCSRRPGFVLDSAWAAIMLAMALGMAMYLIILGLERLVRPWHASVRHAVA